MEEILIEQFNNQANTANKKVNIKNLILIVLFGIIFSFVAQDGIRVVIQKLLEIPADSIGLVQWGDTFFLRIFASLFAMVAGTFVIGTFLKTRARLAGVIATLPATLFLIASLIFGATIIGGYEYSFDAIKAMLLRLILAILLPIVGYFSSGWGQEYRSHFQRPKSILNIKWYNWLWIFPFYLNKVVAIPLFALILLVKFDFSESWAGMYYLGLLDFIINWGYYLGRIILLFIIVGLFLSVKHVYSLLTEESKTTKEKWKKGIIIFGHVLLFSVLYVLLFGQYLYL